MKSKLLAMILAGSAFTTAAQTAPLWLRNAAISPDGATIAFTYMGDIYTVPTSGGRANRITTDKGYDTAPVWSPDGQRLAFTSDRMGSDDVYVVSAVGGNPTRVTFNSAAETALAWADDNHLLLSAKGAPARESIQGPFLGQTYLLDVSKPGSRPEMFLSMPMHSASFAKDGRLLYADRKSYEDPLRKHERSSGTADIWLATPIAAEKGKQPAIPYTFSKLTTFNGHDFNPVWYGQDSYYYLSEEDGTLNVWSNDLRGNNKRQITHYEKHPVRSLSVAKNGSMAYSWDGELYYHHPGGEPTKVNVTIATDNFDPDQVKRYVSGGATSMAVSPDGKEIAFVLRGDIYVTTPDYKTARRITNTAAQERTVNFAPDGRTLVYDSDRQGHWQLFTARIKDDKDKNFTYADEIIVDEPLYSCPTSAQQPAFSPDGKKVAFLENRTALRVVDVKSKKAVTALDGKWNYSYSDGDIPFSWSPDSRWLLTNYIGHGGWNNIDVAIAKADGSEVVDLSESGYADGNPKWALGGKAITYTSGKYGYKSHGSWGNEVDIIMMVLDGEAWDQFNLTEEDIKTAREPEKEKTDDLNADEKEAKKKEDAKKAKEVPELKFDLANRSYRRVRLTPMSGHIGDYYLDPKGEKLYYTSITPEGRRNLYMHDIKEGKTSVLVANQSGDLLPTADGSNLFVNGSSGMQRIAIPSGSVKNIEYQAPYDRKPSAEREYIYDHMLQQVAEKFYDPELHGVDWQGYGEAYRRFLPHINNNRDFANLMSEILGELNASHTGARAYGSGAPMSTASLGAYYDDSYTGSGLKVAEVLPRGPLAGPQADVQAGDVITHIDGVEIQPGSDISALLDGKAGKRITLNVDRKGRKSGKIQVRPISAGAEQEMLYQRWVERNQAEVARLSGGRVAYVHVKGMDSPSFRTVYDQLLGKYRNCDAVIVDTRYNGGGWLHNDIAQLLSGREYVRFAPRGRYIGSEPFSQWNKPSAMLVNEANYSDAHGTPFTYQTLGIGPLIGAPVPGTMTAVWWENQIDPSLVFGIPQVTCTDTQGNVLENRQLNPNLTIYNDPADVLQGRDAQLEGAVQHLLDQLEQK